jgi:glutamyl-tRNA reductase
MRLLVAGVSHKTAPVEIRESLAFPEAALPEALAQLARSSGIAEAAIVSTCNRVEVLAAFEEGADAEAAVREFLVARGATSGTRVAEHLYSRMGKEAVHHVFRVASSLDSMVLGEPQILGQLKQAYAVARQQGCLHGVLETVLTRAFSVAKRVRSETGIGQMAVSVSFAAVELARKIFGSLGGKTILIVGAGKMSELAARHLRRSGASRILVTNRTYERAVEMARVFDGTPVEYNRFLSVLPEADIVIASSGASEYILRKDDMQRAIAARRYKPVFLIDIAVPRNIDPAINDIDSVFLYDIDDLQEVVNSNLRERLKEAEHAEQIVAQEVERTLARVKVQEVTPTIVGLQEQLEQVRAAELEKARRRMGPLTPQQEETLEALTRAIVNKIAHGPIAELRRQAGKPEGVHVIAAIRRVFGLEQ